MKVKFYKCPHCKNLIYMINDSGVNPVCCGDKMKEIIAGTVDASKEKHIPSVTVNGSNVDVVIGEVIHPMTEDHFIEWIFLETEHGIQMKKLNPKDEPKASFTLKDDKLVAVYEYCNLHGLWKKSL